MQLAGSKELVSGVINNNLCIGCGACVSLCPYFKSHKGKTVMLFQCSREKGRCFAYCPKAEVDLDNLSQFMFGKSYGNDPMGSYIQVRSAKAGRAVSLKDFQTAGCVSSLLMFALDRGIIDAAVVTERKGARGNPVVVTDPAKIPLYASTGYSASPVVAGFNEAVSSGYKKIGIVGTPCQVTAVTQMRTNPLEVEGFSDTSALVIGLFCTWALDTMSFEKILKSKIDVAKIKKYDIPPPPAEIMKVYASAESVDIPLSEIRAVIPASCSYCYDMTAEFADISAGVFEGREKQNILITRTERGEEILQAAISAGFIEAEILQAGDVDGLSQASMNKKKKGMAKCRDGGLINREGGLSLLRMNSDTFNFYEKL